MAKIQNLFWLVSPLDSSLWMPKKKIAKKKWYGTITRLRLIWSNEKKKLIKIDKYKTQAFSWNTKFITLDVYTEIK